MKKIWLTMIMTGLMATAFSQSRLGSVEYQKVNRDAVITEVPFPEKIILTAIEDSMQKLGYKGKETKGFLVFKAVKLAALGDTPYDLYFQVERKSRKEKEQSLVTLMISKDFDNFLNTESDAAALDKAKNYMDNFRNWVAVYELEEQINNQQDVVKKNEKKMNDLQGEAEDLQKKKKKIESQIEDNIKDQGSLKSEIEVQKQVLETLKAKRKS